MEAGGRARILVAEDVVTEDQQKFIKTEIAKVKRQIRSLGLGKLPAQGAPDA